MAELHEEGNTLVDIQTLIISVMVSIIVGRRTCGLIHYRYNIHPLLIVKLSE